MSKNIGDILTETNNTLFLPGIQREFVWEPKDIELLFNSVVKDFPIGSIIVWDVRGKNQYLSYEFIRHLLADSGRPPSRVENEWKRNNDATNDDAQSLIIDGQQRMTALNIGFLGSIIEYEGGTGHSRSNSSQWIAKRLCINVLANPESGYSPSEDYEISFRASEQDYEPQDEDKIGYTDANKLWVPFSEFVDETGYPLKKEDVLAKILPKSRKYKNKDSTSPFDISVPTRHYNKENSEYSSEVYENVFSVVSEVTQTLRNYKVEFKDDRNDWEKSEVQTIFNRINTKGKRPKAYQMLMSRMMSYWPYEKSPVNAREDVEEVVSELSALDYYGPKIERKDVLQTYCYISGVTLRRSDVTKLSQKRLLKMKTEWDANMLEKSIRNAIKDLTELGFTPKSMNLMPIISLLSTFHYKSKIDRSELDMDKHKQEIFEFISKVLLANDSNNITRRSKTEEFAEFMKQFMLPDSKQRYFPGNEILQHFGYNPSKSDLRSLYSGANYTDDSTEDSYCGKEVFTLLSQILMLNGQFGSTPVEEYQVDHIYPKQRSFKHELSIHTLGNLQFLKADENNVKDEKWPLEWLQDYYGNENHMKTWHYPNIKLEKENYDSFVLTREALILNYMSSEFSIDLTKSDVISMMSEKHGKNENYIENNVFPEQD